MRSIPLGRRPAVIAALPARQRLPEALFIIIAAFAAVMIGACLSPADAESEKTSPQMCSHRLHINWKGRLFDVPCCRSRALGDGHQTATRAVIVIQSSVLNAGDCFRWMRDAAVVAKAQHTTLFFAVQFPVFKDIAAHRLHDNVPVWEDGDWALGGDSLKLPGIRAAQISSFDVVDELIKSFYDRSKFPRLHHVVIAGQSAGGQFANRYAVTNGIHEESAAKGLRMRYVVMNPSHYLYLDRKRPSPVDGVMKVPNDRTVEVLNSLLPADERHDPGSVNCRRYNDYPKGLQNLWRYAVRRRPDDIRNQYKKRDVRYLVGELDNTRSVEGLSKHCSSDLQGLERRTRANLYWAHLKNIFGDDIAKYQRIVVVPGLGHGSENMFKHPKGGIEHVFDVR